MYQIKCIALDIYGTVLMIDDSENIARPRKGLDEFFQICREREIEIISSSDNGVGHVRNDLSESGVALENFYDFMQFKKTPKEFKEILGRFNIKPLELFVIGDDYEKDIQGAKDIGANYILVPSYINNNKFDISKTIL